MGNITEFLNSYTFVAILIIIALALLAYDNHLRKAEQRISANNYIAQEFGKTYFCGYDLWTIHLYEFFPRLRKSVDFGFCALVAATSMLALKNNPTARLVFAYAGKNRFFHVWVEFKYQRHWYVIDPCWYYPFVQPRNDWNRMEKAEVLRQVDYEEFWKYSISGQFYAKMSHPETSWLIYEIMQAYGFTRNEDGTIQAILNPWVDEMVLEEKDGKHISLQLFYRYPEIVFSRRIMHQMMQRPQCQRLHAHTVRKVKRMQKLVRSNFLQWLSENYPEEYEQEVAAVRQKLAKIKS